MLGPEWLPRQEKRDRHRGHQQERYKDFRNHLAKPPHVTSRKSARQATAGALKTDNEGTIDRRSLANVTAG
jgi:hypothetical protein